MNLIVIAFLLTSSLSFACNPYPYVLDEKGMNGGITQGQWDAVLDRLHKIYQPYLTPAGIELRMVRMWSDNTVNAYPGRMDNKWYVNMYGGFARSPFATEDSFVLLACHEIGHHFGGTPFYEMSNWAWASAEGQADYFATLKCMRTYFEKENNAAFLKDKSIPETVNRECTRAWPNPKDAAICKRSALAGFDMNMVWTRGKGGFAFETPDPKRAINTYSEHPKYQCRLDTLFSGALCRVSRKVNLSMTDPDQGTCNVRDGSKTGRRPPCWYVDPLSSF